MRALPWVVLNQRTAITRVLARRIMTPGSNPTSLAKQLLECAQMCIYFMSSIITCVVVACTTGNRTKFIMKIARFSRLYLLYLSKGPKQS